MNSPDDADEEGLVEEAHVQKPIAALVPEPVGVGVLATTVIVAQNGNETVLDFVVRIARPFQVVARVVLPNSVYPRVVAALRDNIAMYENQIGQLKAPPASPNEAGSSSEASDSPPPSLEDIYEELKFPTALHSGVYANAVTIGHTDAEFWIDFITNFYPRASVSCRVYVAAGHIQRILKTLDRTAH